MGAARPGCGVTDFDCGGCDLIVPDHRATVTQAINDALAPGTVCIRAGAYLEHIEPRHRVDLQGEGPATRIVGNVDVRSMLTTDAAPTQTAFRDFVVEVPVQGSAIGICPPTNLLCSGRYSPPSRLALLLERVELRGVAGGGTKYCMHVGASGDLDFTIRDSLCHSGRGIRITGSTGTTTPVDRQILVERTRFEPMMGRTRLFDGLALLVSSAWNPAGIREPAPVGSRLRGIVRNNEFVDASPAVYMTQHFRLAAVDEGRSGYDFFHNTFATTGTSSFNNNTRPAAEGPALRLANNLYWNTTYAGPAPAVDQSNFQPAMDPFVDLAGAGNVQLVGGSAPVDTADPSYSVTDDFAGTVRPIDGDGDGVADADVGAHEYQPLM